MKKIILIRHAKSSWDNPMLQDYDRPLADRGLADAPKMAILLKNRRLHVDRILSSTAERASQTARITAAVLGYPETAIQWDKSLYHASANHLLAVIQSQPEKIQTIVLVGHNPGLTEFIALLGGKLDNLPTSGQFAFTLLSSQWKDLSVQSCTPDWWDSPKK
ncbi:MAG: histidine phosphatase family protein [Bacteroidetes bacterium]|nr:histidine phosphatase family protein [Bacteroidota bacterium]MDA1267902.1 histidine phosphatase family protein [Bacteroidota bacterium]